LESADIHGKLLNVTFDFTGAVLKNPQNSLSQLISLQDINNAGIINLKYHVKNVTSLEDLANHSNLIVHFLKYNRTKTIRLSPWNETPKLIISQENEQSRINSGEVAKFRVYSPHMDPTEIKLTIILGTIQAPIFAYQKNFNLTEKPGEILEIQIPQDLLEPTSIQLGIIGKCWSGFSKNASEFEKKLSQCELAGETYFDVNMQKPSLEIHDVSIVNERFQFLLLIKGGANNIEHVSLDLTKRDDDDETLGGSATEDDEVDDNFQSWESDREDHESKLLEFDFPEDNNGTVTIPLIMNQKDQFGKYEIKAYVISNTTGGFSETNTKTFSLSEVHIPLFPQSTVGKSLIEGEGWIKDELPFFLEE